MNLSSDIDLDKSTSSDKKMSENTSTTSINLSKSTNDESINKESMYSFTDSKPTGFNNPFSAICDNNLNENHNNENNREYKISQQPNINANDQQNSFQTNLINQETKQCHHYPLKQK